MPLEQGLLAYLELVRKRIIFTVIFFAAMSVAAYPFSDQALEELVRRGSAISNLIFLSPGEAFFTRIKLALALGAIATFPVILWHIWRLMWPKLSRLQRALAFLLVPVGTGLFLLGAWFALTGVLPVAMRFFLGFQNPQLEAAISVSSYMGFVLMLTLPFGLMFELPLVVLFLSRLGILHPSVLAKNRKYALLVIAILAAGFTPGPDVFSQLLMGIPMYLLYEVSIIVARLAYRRRHAEDLDAREEPAD